MIKSWSDAAWEDFEYWMKQDKKTLRRILQLLKDIDRNGYDGIGKPERLSGIGTALMKAMLQLLKDKGYKQTSLSVQKENYAVRMYRKVGFEVVGENEEEYIMICNLAGRGESAEMLSDVRNLS